MSVELRKKFLKELERDSTVAYRRIVAQFFDRGALRLERKKWDIIYQNAHLAALEKAGVIHPGVSYKPPTLPTTVWKSLFNQLKGSTPPMLQSGRRISAAGGIAFGNLVRFVKADFTYTNDMITLPFVRGKNAKGEPYTGNLERRAELDLKKFMTSFCNSNHFVKNVKSNIKASQQEYEHGRTGEQDFRTGAYSDRKTRGTSKNTGAQGTVTDQRIAAFLIKEAAGAYSSEPWFDSMFEAIFTKWQDMFGYDTELDQNDKANSVESVVTFKGAVVPVKSRYNPGAVDRELLDEMKRFIEHRGFFVQEIMRLNSMIDRTTAEKLFSDSPGPTKRMEAAAIKLISAGLLDNVSDEIIKNKRKVGRPKAHKKRGRPTKSSARGASSSSVKTRKGRVSKKTAKNNAPAPSSVGLKELINAALPQALLERMHPPALQNRTGRFRRSAEVTNVNIGPRGGTQIDYTYMKDPYQTFEPGGKMGSVNRDPRRLIGGTIREIAQEITGRKFITTRRR